MRRREFIGLGAGAGVGLLVPGAAAAQTGRIRRIGVLWITHREDLRSRNEREAFDRQMRELGWIQGLNVEITYRWASNDLSRMAAFAVELVGSSPDLIVTEGTPGLAALRRATRAVPVVFANVTDPVGQGFVESLSRPGGNVTGFALFEPTIGGKWLEVLRAIAPQARRVGLLFNPAMAPYSGLYMKSLQAAGPSFGIEPFPVPVADGPMLATILSQIAMERETGLIVLQDAFTFGHRDAIVRTALERRIPAVYAIRSYVESGGLISFGADFADQFRQAATYADRILKGTRPGDLPVEQPTKFELVINLRTAQALGLDIAPSLLARADEVIE